MIVAGLAVGAAVGALLDLLLGTTGWWAALAGLGACLLPVWQTYLLLERRAPREPEEG